MLPLSADVEAVSAAAHDLPLIVTLEEHSIIGGLGGAVAEVVCELGKARNPSAAGTPGTFSSRWGARIIYGTPTGYPQSE